VCVWVCISGPPRPCIFLLHQAHEYRIPEMVALLGNEKSGELGGREGAERTDARDLATQPLDPWATTHRRPCGVRLGLLEGGRDGKGWGAETGCPLPAGVFSQTAGVSPKPVPLALA
jgi:hypothetical protein